MTVFLRLSAIDSFEEWMAEIVSIDREATSDLKRIAEMLKDTVSFKRQRTDDPTPNFYRPSPAENVHPLRPSQIYNMQPTQSMHNNPSASHFLGTGANTVQPSSCPPNHFQKRCLPLTPAKISLLNAHKGCRKCRRFYVAHHVPTCPNGFPDGATYVPLTEEMALEAMRKVAVASTSPYPILLPPPATFPMIFLSRAQTLPNLRLPSLLPIIIIPRHLPYLIPSSRPHLILPPLISSKTKIGIQLLLKQTPYRLLQSALFYRCPSSLLLSGMVLILVILLKT